VAAIARSLVTCGKQKKKKYIAIDLGSEEVTGGQRAIANVCVRDWEVDIDERIRT